MTAGHKQSELRDWIDGNLRQIIADPALRTLAAVHLARRLCEAEELSVHFKRGETLVRRKRREKE